MYGDVDCYSLFNHSLASRASVFVSFPVFFLLQIKLISISAQNFVCAGLSFTRGPEAKMVFMAAFLCLSPSLC